ncbi:hypothetical protein ABTX85_36600 [Streptomyces sp. NPDC096097]
MKDFVRKWLAWIERHNTSIVAISTLIAALATVTGVLVAVWAV